MEAEKILSDTSDSNIAREREQLWEQFVSDHVNGRINDIMSKLPTDNLKAKYNIKSQQIKNGTGLELQFHNAESNVIQKLSNNKDKINDGKSKVNSQMNEFSNQHNQQFNKSEQAINNREREERQTHSYNKDDFSKNDKGAKDDIEKSKNNQSFVDDNVIDDSNKKHF